MNWTSAGAFFKDPSFDYDTRSALGATAQGIGDAGLVFATLSQVSDGDLGSWLSAWTATADALSAGVTPATSSRHAQWALLTASEYHAKAQTGASDDDAFEASFGRQQAAFDAYIDASGGRFVRVPIPYEDTTLPGYLLRPDDSDTARPTLIMTNGSDGSLPSMIADGGTEAFARGWNVFLYDGPGQQSMLFQRNVPFRYDWEAVLTPVVDTLLRRPDVAGDRLLGYAISQGGYWLPRALAFEHRLTAAVVDGGVVDVAATWNAMLPPPLLELLRADDKDAFNQALNSGPADPRQEREFEFRARPYGQSDAYGTFAEVQKYQLRDVAAEITTPLLVLDAADDQFFPGQSAQLCDLLPKIAERLPFTAAEGANFHCEPLAKATVAHRYLDWLSGKLGGRLSDKLGNP
ncbi:alpha/beta hydrolase family protein [Actinoplanes solisilvae]|uniref:alpha/beta hydrolase family protein n=1 Tax=Actinoplanes solisilvae TaxID=2486853 RepID=UPI00196A7170|nr:hypothetical protein [Actinoplanes solisilvae]